MGILVFPAPAKPMSIISARRSVALVLACLLVSESAGAQDPAQPPPAPEQQNPPPPAAEAGPPEEGPPKATAAPVPVEQTPAHPPKEAPAEELESDREPASAAPPMELADTATSGEPPPGTSSVETHGFVSQGFIKTTSNDYLANSDPGSVEFNEIGLNFTVQPLDQLRLGVQLFARDLGPVGNYTPRLDWFYLDYRFWDWFGIRAGRTKVPFGLYNETSDIDSARTPVLLPQSVYPTQNRDFLLAQTGGELYGTVALGSGGDLEYRAYGGTLFFDTSESAATVEDLSVPYLFGGRLMWQTPLEGLQVGGSAQVMRLDATFNLEAAEQAQLEASGALPPGFEGPLDLGIDALLWVASLEYVARDLTLATEYSRWRTTVESAFPGLVETGDRTSERFHAMGSYRVTPWFSPGVYYSALFPNVDDREGIDAWQHDFAGTVRFDINANWLVKVEGHYLHGTAALDSSLNGGRPRSALDKDWGLFLIKTTAYF